jgi:hypothetical protein
MGGRTAGGGKISSQKKSRTIARSPMMIAMTALFLYGPIFTIVAFAEGMGPVNKYPTVAVMDAGFNVIFLFGIGLGVVMFILLFVVRDHNRTASGDGAAMGLGGL